jgi:excisionase family DNA binding protein
MMLTTTEAAKRLSVHPDTIRRLVKAGRLKAVKLSIDETTRSQLRIDEKELQAFIEGKAPAHDSGLKTFQIDSYDYQAEDCIQGIFINPVLPENFWTEPLEERTEEDMRLWQDLPFIISDNDFYKVYCLNGGAWDRPSLIGGFDSRDKAVEFIVETYRK